MTNNKNILDFVEGIRHECAFKWSQKVLGGEIPPIRGMARLTREARDLIFEECFRRGFSKFDSEGIVKNGIIDRTIGDVDVRGITEEGYQDLAELLGITIPGERSTGGKQYNYIRKRMQEIELDLLNNHNIDMRMYDIYGVGNSVLRHHLSNKMFEDYGLLFPIEQIYTCLGGMHGLDRTIRMLRKYYLNQGINCVFGFPTPGFAVAKWQAEISGIPVHLIQTDEKANYKLTPQQLCETLRENPNIKVLYLTITNNPTAYSYTPSELELLFEIVKLYMPDSVIIADAAYIGTADTLTDKSRMLVFQNANITDQTIFVSSLSKTYTLTGDKFGWVTFGSRQLADFMSPGWNNFSAGLPREWQLSFMVYLELFRDKPEIIEKIRHLYSIRRLNLITELHSLNQKHNIFEEIGKDDGGGIYNWSKLKQGEDVFSLFEKTGIAGVPGSAFGYSDRFIRFSVGIVPCL